MSKTNNQSQKKKPERRCVGCGETKLKVELVRIVRTPEGEVAIDRTGRANGRGAYICPDKNCLKKARKSKRLDGALSCTVTDSVYEELEAEIQNDK